MAYVANLNEDDSAIDGLGSICLTLSKARCAHRPLKALPRCSLGSPERHLTTRSAREKATET